MKSCKNVLELAGDFPAYKDVALAGTRWKWIFPDTSPFAGFIPTEIDWNNLNKPPRIRYSEWLSREDLCKRNGIYIWTLKMEGLGFRFVHVGMSRGNTSSMKGRTQRHCCYQFARGRDKKNLCTHDRIHVLSPTDDGLGSLGKALWDGNAADSDERDSLGGLEERANAAQIFLSNVRVIYLSPETNSDIDLIHPMESVIGRAGAELMSLKGVRDPASDETTNTLNGKMRVVLSEAELESVAFNLNKICATLPEKRRAKIT